MEEFSITGNNWTRSGKYRLNGSKRILANRLTAKTLTGDPIPYVRTSPAGTIIDLNNVEYTGTRIQINDATVAFTNEDGTHSVRFSTVHHPPNLSLFELNFNGMAYIRQVYTDSVRYYVTTDVVLTSPTQTLRQVLTVENTGEVDIPRGTFKFNLTSDEGSYEAEEYYEQSEMKRSRLAGAAAPPSDVEANFVIPDVDIDALSPGHLHSYLLNRCEVDFLHTATVHTGGRNPHVRYTYKVTQGELYPGTLNLIMSTFDVGLTSLSQGYVTEGHEFDVMFGKVKGIQIVEMSRDINFKVNQYQIIYKVTSTVKPTDVIFKDGSRSVTVTVPSGHHHITVNYVSKTSHIENANDDNDE